MQQIVLKDDIGFDEWLAFGKSKTNELRNNQWELADWFAYGKAKAKEDASFADQLNMALPEIGEDRKKLEQAAKVAEVFPKEERTLALSFDHYAKVSHLGYGQARPILEKALAGNIPARKLIDSIDHSPNLFDMDSWLKSISALWNRGDEEGREHFLELASESNLDFIRV
jgi:hypothetical protein